MDLEKRYGGIIKWYNPNKAYGFVFVSDLEADTKTVFVHKALLRNSLITPQEGDKCNFDIREGDKGLYCQDLVLGEIGEND